MKNKIAYLTIDDAPSLNMKEKVDYLKRKGIPAVWFGCGDLLEQHPQQAVYAIQNGFVLGNHAYNHPHFSDLELKLCFDQIRRTDEIIETLYKQAGVQRPVKYFRFPYGDKGGPARKQALQAYLRDLGYSRPSWKKITYHYFQAGGLQQDLDWHWTYDVMEWAILAEDHPFGIDSLTKVFARMEENDPEDRRGLNSGSSAEIVLMHDHPGTAAYFQPLVERLLEKGLKFVNPGE